MKGCDVEVRFNAASLEDAANMLGEFLRATPEYHESYNAGGIYAYMAASNYELRLYSNTTIEGDCRDDSAPPDAVILRIISPTHGDVDFYKMIPASFIVD